ncbi:MAG: DedA family protein [Tepidisphaeraceae bacterium]
MILALSIDLVKTWILQRGWWGGAFVSFLLLFACGLGLPLPEDIPLIISGAFLCHDPNGVAIKEWIIVGSLNWLGIVGGDICLYWISRHFGRNVTKLPFIGNHITEDRIDKVGGWFETYGVGVVAVGRLFAGIRGAMVITAGITRFNFAHFLNADVLAAIVSGGLFMLLGHWVGESLNDQTIHRFKHYFVIGAVLLAIGLVGYIIWKRRSHAKKPA